MPARSRHLIACIACVVFSGLLPLCHSALAQQPSESPLVLVRVRDHETSSTSLFQFSGEGKQVGARISLGAAVRDAFVSENGQWIGVQRFDPENQKQSLEYRAMAASRTTLVRVDTNEYAVFAAFSRDSRYLLYGTVTGSNSSRVWVIGIIELSSGARADYTGEYTFGNNSKVPFSGIPWPLDFNGRQLWFLTPDPDRVPVALFSTDLPGFQVGSHLALPGPLKSWHKLPYSLSAPRFSPDGSRLLYLFDNPANPPANYNPAGVSRTVNSLGVIDLNTGTDTVVAQAGTGQALEVAVWWYTGDQVVFTGGNYQKSGRLVSPGFYSVDVRSGQVTNTLPSFFRNSSQESIIDMLVCSGGLFYVTRIEATETLYVAPLKDPQAGKTLLSGTNMDLVLLRCFPPSSAP